MGVERLFSTTTEEPCDMPPAPDPNLSADAAFGASHANADHYPALALARIAACSDCHPGNWVQIDPPVPDTRPVGAAAGAESVMWVGRAQEALLDA